MSFRVHRGRWGVNAAVPVGLAVEPQGHPVCHVSLGVHVENPVVLQAVRVELPGFEGCWDTRPSQYWKPTVLVGGFDVTRQRREPLVSIDASVDVDIYFADHGKCAQHLRLNVELFLEDRKPYVVALTRKATVAAPAHGQPKYAFTSSCVVCYNRRSRGGGVHGWAGFELAPGENLQAKAAEVAAQQMYFTGTIVAVMRQIRRVSDGTLGGFIADESCLSQEGSCFVYGGFVFPGARIEGNAQVYKAVYVRPGAYIGGNAYVAGEISVEGRVEGNAHVTTNVFAGQRITG